jgi:hypothetical protein
VLINARAVVNILALVFAVIALIVGGVVLLSIEQVDAIIIGIHELSLTVAVILHIAASFLKE